MLDRIQGLIVIVNTLLPVVLLIFLAVIFLGIEGQIRLQWQQARTSMEGVVAQAEQSAVLVKNTATATGERLMSAQASFELMAKDIDTAIEEVNGSITTVGALSLKYPSSARVNTTNVDLKYKKVINETVNVPTSLTVTYKSLAVGENLVAPFNDIVKTMNEIVEPLEELQAAVAEIEQLKGPMSQGLETFQRQVSTAASQMLMLSDYLMTLFRQLSYVLIAVGGWMSLCYLFWVRERLQRGWRLLAGTE